MTSDPRTAKENEPIMIARVWRARTTGTAATSRYQQVFESEVMHELRGLPGFRGAYLLARHDAEAMELTTVTLFDSLDTVKAFAGADHTRERVTPPARATLRDSDPHVLHFDVLVHTLVH
ncbi:hypothetical protein ACIHFD_54950 [Nonomuraea sp. NPDC051941]|uniref:hypothetical protein n=1 Tax=Nonomuraea sp. NPDC051941 TaxID=3364373 RepID=UPI0037CC4A47